MENVVYLLGAGFSAPLGLPVMSNFMQMSKDLYFRDHERYKHFQDVFEEINRMAVCKNYFTADLFNIEEILSIFEMTNTLSNSRKKRAFIDYIVDVIKAYTPAPENVNKMGLDQTPTNEFNSCYGHFVLTLFNVICDGTWMNPTNEINHSYSVISLNYDMVLENYLAYFRNEYRCSETVRFCNEIIEKPENGTVFLSKLHGSIDTGNIIPPTWNKGVTKQISKAWRLAYDCLTKANHIRIIGYSLPITDAYIKYLLKSSIIKNVNLKTIDVLCLDSDNQVKSRFDDWICFPNYRFKNARVEKYLSSHHDIKENNLTRSERFEAMHEKHFRTI